MEISKEKQRRRDTISKLEQDLRDQEALINTARNAIMILEKQLEDLPCSHKYDNGESAGKKISYYVYTGSRTYIDSWTGEEVTEDEGHTHHGLECQICHQEI